MPGSEGERTKVTLAGTAARTRDQAGLTQLCKAVERAVHTHRPKGYVVREVVVMLEEGPSADAQEPAPVFIDVYDSGYGHGI